MANVSGHALQEQLLTEPFVILNQIVFKDVQPVAEKIALLATMDTGFTMDLAHLIVHKVLFAVHLPVALLAQQTVYYVMIIWHVPNVLVDIWLKMVYASSTLWHVPN